MILPTLDIEKSHWSSGKKLICGIDEVGRGCFAGPVVVGAVIFPEDCQIIGGLADSKLLTPIQRIQLDPLIKQAALCWGIEETSVEIINNVGIGKATQIAFFNVVKKLSQAPEHILIDVFYINAIDHQIQSPIKDGDKLSASIAAASVIAKVYRDNLMIDLDEKYPEYGFAAHKGYGTKMHQAAIKEHGLCEIHRTSFNLGKFLVD
jgi:ribonuclease HII